MAIQAYNQGPGVVGGGSASYLPTHVGGPKGIQTPSLASSINAIGNAASTWTKSVVEHGKAVANFGKQYEQSVMARQARDADTSAREFFRNRRANTGMLEGAEADNLLYKEDSWQKEQRGNFIESNPGIPQSVSGPLYDKYAQQYLDWSMVHMLQQSKVADDNSRYAAAMELSNTVADAPLHINSLAQGFAEANQIYENRPREAQATKNQLMKTFLASWAERQPVSRNGQEGVVDWWNRNEKGLRPLLGANFPDGADTIRKTKDWVVDQAWKHEQRTWTRQQHAFMMHNRQQAFATQQVFGQVQQMVEQGMTPGADDIMKLALAANLDPDNIHKLQNVTDAFLTKSTKLAGNQIMQAYLPSAVDGGLSDGERVEVTKAFTDQKLSAGNYQTLMRLSDAATAASKKGYNVEWQVASNYLKSMINPQGALDSVNQPQAVDYWAAMGLLQDAVNMAPDAKEVRAILNTNDPESLVSKLATARNVSALDRTRRAFGQETPAALQEDARRIYNPIVEDWRKKKGLQGDAKVLPPLGEFLEGYDNKVKKPPVTEPGEIDPFAMQWGGQ